MLMVLCRAPQFNHTIPLNETHNVWKGHKAVIAKEKGEGGG